MGSLGRWLEIQAFLILNKRVLAEMLGLREYRSSETGGQTCLRIMVDKLLQKRIKCFGTQKNIFNEAVIIIFGTSRYPNI